MGAADAGLTGGKARLFAALELPGDVRAELGRWAGEVAAPLPGLRVLAPESLHVTLCFLGWREAADARRIGEAVAGCAAPVPGLALGAGAWFPPRQPRVLVVEVEDREGALAALQGRVEEALVAHAGHEPEQRAYRPHVTVARARKGARPPGRREPVPPPRPLQFDGAAVTLYRSHLGRGGARYESVSRTEV